MKLNRRTFVAGIGAGVALTGIGGYFLKGMRRNAAARPNIILFITDDMRFDAAGYLGDPVIKTPMLDRLAAGGFIFDNNFVTTSICPVSRASIMTGEYALRHGVHDFETPIKAVSFQHSFPLLLRASGYHTGFIGKWGFGSHLPVKAFDSWHGFSGQGAYFSPKSPMHLTDIQTQQALDFLRAIPAGKPFLLILSYKAPHDPMMPQQRFADLYADITFPRKTTDTADASSRLPPLLRDSHNIKEYTAHGLDRDDEYQAHMRKYYALISGIDDSVGQICAAMEKSGIMDMTSIFFTSDNGMLLGEHGMYSKDCMYEESIRVPLLVRPAAAFSSDLKPGHRSGMSLNIDISPTILSAASVAVPANVEGKDLFPLMRNQDTPWREGFYYEHPTLERWQIVGCEGYRGREWKYTRYTHKDDSNECLFNLKSDPAELDNLAAKPEYAQKLDEMRNLTAKEKAALS